MPPSVSMADVYISVMLSTLTATGCWGLMLWHGDMNPHLLLSVDHAMSYASPLTSCHKLLLRVMKRANAAEV